MEHTNRSFRPPIGSLAMKGNTIFIKLVFYLTFILPSIAQSESQTDPYTLTAKLIKDGYYERAREKLANVVPINEDENQKKHTLLGLISLYEKKFQEAISWFDKAHNKSDPKRSDPYLPLYKAQANFGLKKYKKTIHWTRTAQHLKPEIPSLFLMEARSYFHLKQYQNAWQTLKDGRKIHPDRMDLFQEQVTLMVNLGMYQSSESFAIEELIRHFDTPGGFVDISKVYSRTRAFEQSKHLLEYANIRFSGNIAIRTQLAIVYYKLGQALTAAYIFEQVAQKNPKFYLEASELYLKSRRLYKALSLNSKITDPKDRLKQRLAIYLKLGFFERGLALEPDLVRHDLIQDEQIRYALAYANFKGGYFKRAELGLSLLKDPSLFQKALALRETIMSCNVKPWKCF